MQLDVFARTPLHGNPLAIFTDARGLTDQEMQAVAREMNLSETTFILPRQADVESREGKRVRIFTLEEELPFAGHPALGTALYLYTSAGETDGTRLDLNIGKIPVQSSADSNSGARDRGRREGVCMHIGPRTSRSHARNRYRRNCIGMAESGVSTGLAFAIVPVRRSETLSDLRRDLAKVGALLEGTGAKFCYFLCTERSRSAIRARHACFSMEVKIPPLDQRRVALQAGWFDTDRQNPVSRVLIRQRIEAGRPSEIFVRGSIDGNCVADVCVGGYAVELLRGKLTL